LQENAIDEINKKYGNEYISPIEDYFELSQQMLPQLNMISHDGSIKEYARYEDVMKEWFPIRKKMYELRLHRQIILLTLKIEFHKNELRFISMDATKEINIDKDFEEEEREKILRENNFVKFNKRTLFQPQYIKVDELEYSIKNVGSSYSYIDEITIRMKSKKAVAALEEKIKSLKDELTVLKNTTWKDVWIDEIGKIVKVIEEGHRTKWLFGEKQHVYQKAK